jgi:hypothetical protein
VPETPTPRAPEAPASKPGIPNSVTAPHDSLGASQSGAAPPHPIPTAERPLDTAVGQGTPRDSGPAYDSAPTELSSSPSRGPELRSTDGPPPASHSGHVGANGLSTAEQDGLSANDPRRIPGESESISGSHHPIHDDSAVSPGHQDNGWHSLPDGADNPHYGEPLDQYWESGDYPTARPDNQSTFDLIQHPDEPYGHDSAGKAFTKEEYEQRYNKIGPNGEHWENYPPNDGAVPQTKVEYTSVEAFLRDFGPHMDRIGKGDGAYLGLMPDGVSPSFEARGLPISSLDLPYNRFMLEFLPEGWSIEVSLIAPAFGRDGGALQALIFDENHVKVPVTDLEMSEVLKWQK